MRETLTEIYRTHRKNINENLGLLIALAACGAALWTGYEARRTRLEAASGAEHSLKVQQQSVDAQISSMRLDERPYIRISPVGIKPANKEDDPDDDYQGVFTLVAIGRTPATFLEWNVYCDVLDANQLAGAAQTEKESEKNPIAGEVIIIKETGFTRSTNTQAVMNSGENLEVGCPFSKKDFQSGNPNGDDIDADKQIVTDKSTMETFIVDVAYSDVFNVKHKTQQCFYVPSGGPSPLPKKLLSCKQYKPIVQ